MSIRSFILVFLVGYVITSVASISICSIHGTNPCSCSNAIVTANQPSCGTGNLCARCGRYQPSMVYYKPPTDLYSCSTIVKPAFVPETCPCYCHVTPVQEKESHFEPDPSKISDHTPVDSVSLTLAQSLLDQSKQQVPETKFWFGPTKIPRIDLQKITRKHIPEERLFAMERDVIELKPHKPKWGWGSSESDSSSESSSSESDGRSNEIKRTEVTYKEIGYDRIKVNDDNKDKNTIKLLPPISLHTQSVEERPETENCQFVPGQVVLRKRKINLFDNCNRAESFEDITDRLDSFVAKSRNKFFNNVILNRALGWNWDMNKFNEHTGL